MLTDAWLRQALTDPVAAMILADDAHLGAAQPYAASLRRVAERLGDAPMHRVSPLLLWTELGEAEQAALTGAGLGLGHLETLAAQGPLSSEEVTYVHARLREEKARRVLAEVGDTLRLRAAIDGPEALMKAVFAQLEAAQKILSGGQKEYLRGEEIAEYAVGMLGEYYEAGGRWRTGIDALDDLLSGGVRPGQLIAVGAWPGHGKSLLSQAVADGLTAHNPEAGEAYFLDCEMGVPTVVSRVTQRAVGASPTTAPSFDAALERLSPHLGRIAGSRVIVGSPRELTLDQAIRHSQVAVSLGCRVIVWDGGHILKVRGRDNRQQELEEITRTAKRFARDHSVVLILTGQLNQDRPPQNGGLLRAPEREDFKGGRSFSEDADYVLLLRRVDRKPCAGDAELYGVASTEELARRRGLTWVKLAKDRHGGQENELAHLHLSGESLRYAEETEPLSF